MNAKSPRIPSVYKSRQRSTTPKKNDLDITKELKDIGRNMKNIQTKYSKIKKEPLSKKLKHLISDKILLHQRKNFTKLDERGKIVN